MAFVCTKDHLIVEFRRSMKRLRQRERYTKHKNKNKPNVTHYVTTHQAKKQRRKGYFMVNKAYHHHPIASQLWASGLLRLHAKDCTPFRLPPLQGKITAEDEKTGKRLAIPQGFHPQSPLKPLAAILWPSNHVHWSAESQDAGDLSLAPDLRVKVGAFPHTIYAREFPPGRH